MSAEPKVSTAIAPDRPTGPASGSSPELHREIVWEPSPERQFSRPTRLVLLVVAIALLWFTGRVLLLGFAGLLFGLFLQTAGRWMSGWSRIPYRMCVGLVTLILLGTLAAAGWRFQNEFVEQWNHFTTTLPAAVQAIEDRLDEYAWGDWLARVLDRSSDDVIGERLLAGIRGAAALWFNFLVQAVVVFAVGLFGALEPRVYRQGLLHLVPLRRRERGAEVLDESLHTLRRWLFGKLVSMVIVGACTGLGLWWLGIQSALLLALLAAILEFVPNFGPILASLPALVIALADGPELLLSVALLYGGVQLVESNFILPLVERQAVRVPPALTILVLILMGGLAGPLGVLVSTPLLAVTIVLIRRLYVEDVLHDRHLNPENSCQ